MSRFILSSFADEISSDLDTQIRVLHQNNIHYVEMRGVNKIGVADFTTEFAKEIKQKLNDNNIRVSAIGSPLGKVSIESDIDSEIKRLLHLIELARIFETNFIRIFSFYLPDLSKRNSYKARVFENLGKIADIAKENNVVLLHENEKGIYGYDAEGCLEIAESFKDRNIAITFDPANFIQCGVESYPYAYHMLSPYIKYLHIKDANRSDGGCVPAGFGDGNIELMLRDLHNNDYDGFLSIEPHLGMFDGYSNLELNPDIKKLPLGGEKLFGIAAAALKSVLSRIDGAVVE